jgi:hypothetical protein
VARELPQARRSRPFSRSRTTSAQRAPFGKSEASRASGGDAASVTAAGSRPSERSRGRHRVWRSLWNGDGVSGPPRGGCLSIQIDRQRRPLAAFACSLMHHFSPASMPMARSMK